MRSGLVSLVARTASAARAVPGVIPVGTQSPAELNARTRPGPRYAKNSAASTALSWVSGYISAWNSIGHPRWPRIPSSSGMSIVPAPVAERDGESTWSMIPKAGTTIFGKITLKQDVIV